MRKLAVASALALFFSHTALAHHSVAAEFDTTKQAELEGEITSVSSGGARLQVDTEDADDTCVAVPGGAGVFRVTSDDGGAEVEAIERSQLQAGDEVSAFGSQDDAGFEADTVIVVDES